MLAKSCAIITGFITAFPAIAKSESVDFTGSALVDCVCPIATQAGDCGLAGRENNQYTVLIHVRDGINVDESEVCFRHKDLADPLCCAEPRGSYQGDIVKKCPGSDTC